VFANALAVSAGNTQDALLTIGRSTLIVTSIQQSNCLLRSLLIYDPKPTDCPGGHS
jgi:hypothetical protein